VDYLQILRQFKIGPFAVFDTVTAYLGVFLIAPLLTKLFSKMNIIISRAGWIWLTLPISVLFHLVFRQNTPFMKMLLDQRYLFIPVIMLIGMFYMGVIHSKKSYFK
jgi:hypothetical protein